MGRLIRLFAVLALLVSAAVTGGMAAAAAGAPASSVLAASATCGGSSGYPPQTGTSVSVSTTKPYQGETIEVSGSGFNPGDTVTIYLGSTVAAHATVGSDGTFQVSLKVTGKPGTVVVKAVGSTCGSGSASLIVQAGSSVLPASTHRNPGGTTPSGGGGGLASTGTDIALLVAIAVVLLGGGGYLLRAARRRHPAH